MPDWTSLALNGLWVLGLATILAAFGFADYQAHVTKTRLRTLLAAPGFQLPLMIGLTLFSVALVFLSHRWWEQVLWGLLALLCAWQAWVAWRRQRHNG